MGNFTLFFTTDFLKYIREKVEITNLSRQILEYERSNKVFLRAQLKDNEP